MTDEKLALPLRERWVHRGPAPRPAWPLPARDDVFHKKYDLKPTMTYDRAAEVVVAGGAVYFGSSASDKLTCLDVSNGQVRWSFYAEGPIRLAPAVAGQNVFIASDDGYLYCLTAADGKLRWKYLPGGEDSRLPGNERMISRWPVRAGIVVQDGAVYVAAGLFPPYGAFLCSVDAERGAERWKKPLDGLSPEGNLAAVGSLLLVPSGSAWASFDAEGKPARQRLPGPPMPRQMFHAEKALRDRWKAGLGTAFRTVLAGDMLVVGRDGEVAVYSAADGTELWKSKVAGRAYALAVAAECLFVSTDQGAIHCFGKEPK